MDYYLGVDIGTGSCKAVAFDERGRPVAEASREYNLITSQPGWAELDPHEVIDKCFEVIRETAAQLSQASSMGIGISSQGEAFTLLDFNGNILCKALVSSDTRAKDVIRDFIGSFGEDKLYRITGHTPHPMFSLFKILWIRENQPELWERTRRILCFEDLLQYRLGISNPSMGWPLAGRTMLFDVKSHRWSSEILESARIPESMLSKPEPSGTVAGIIPDELCNSLKLTKGCFVVTGGHDQTCAALGAGAIESGVAVYATGSVECITPSFEKPLFTPELKRSNLCTYDHAAPGRYASVAFSLTGGNLLRWFRDEFGAVESELGRHSGRNPYEILLEQMPEGPTGLLVLPYFTPSGTPYFDVNAKGAILGLDLNTSRTEIMKALLEGVAMEIRLNLEILEASGCEVKELRAIGGGARSARHNQLKADIIGRPITVLDVAEAGCLGVAMLARSARTGIQVERICKDWVRTVNQVTPEPGDPYSQRYEVYKKMYRHISPLLYELNQTVKKRLL